MHGHPNSIRRQNRRQSPRVRRPATRCDAGTRIHGGRICAARRCSTANGCQVAENAHGRSERGALLPRERGAGNPHVLADPRDWENGPSIRQPAATDNWSCRQKVIVNSGCHAAACAGNTNPSGYRSGRNSCGVTLSLLASTTWRTRSAGTRDCSHCETADWRTPIRAANADWVVVFRNSARFMRQL